MLEKKIEQIKTMPKKKKAAAIAAFIIVIIAAALLVHAWNNNGPKEIRNIANKNGYELDRFKRINTGEEIGKARIAQLEAYKEGTGRVNIVELESEDAAKEFALGCIKPAIQFTDIEDPEKDLTEDKCCMFIIDDRYNIVCYKDNIAAWTAIGLDNKESDSNHIEATNKLMEELGFKIAGNVIKGKTVKTPKAETGKQTEKKADTSKSK